MQRNAEAALAPHPFRVELRRKPGSLTWPFRLRELTPMLIPMAGSALFFVVTLRAVLENPPNDASTQLARGLPALMAAVGVVGAAVWLFQVLGP